MDTPQDTISARSEDKGGIVFLCPSAPERPKTGGEIYHQQIIEGLRGEGWRVERWTPGERTQREALQDLWERLQAARSWASFLVFDSWLYRKLWPVVGFLRLQGSWQLISLSQLCYWARYESNRSRGLHWLMTQAALRPAHLHIGVSAAVLSWDLKGLPSMTPQAVVYPGCEERQHPPPKNRKQESVFRVISVGNYSPRKGFHLLIEALHQLNQRGATRRPVELHLVGNLLHDPVYVQHCQALVQRWELTQHVLFHDWCDRAALLEMVRGADLFALASQGEGFGMVVLEAMSQGLPVLLGDFETAFEILGESGAGWVVPKDRPEAYARQLALAERHPKLEALGRRAQQRAQRWGQSWKDSSQQFSQALWDLKQHPCSSRWRRLQSYLLSRLFPRNSS